MIIEHNFKMPFDDNLFTSVFNSNEDDIIKAKQCFKIIYGMKQYKELEKILTNGLMSIFDYVSTDEAVLFALIISQLIKQRRS